MKIRANASLEAVAQAAQIRAIQLKNYYLASFDRPGSNSFEARSESLRRREALDDVLELAIHTSRLAGIDIDPELKGHRPKTR
jgi:hypothetical protein